MQHLTFLPNPTTTSMQQAGVVMVVRCVPDLFTGERLNIGVVAIDNTGRRLAKMISEPGRLDCLYGDAANNVLWLAKAAEEAFLKCASMPSPQIIIDDPAPYYNSSLEDVLNNVFADQITVALPRRQDATKKALDDESAWIEVANQIKLMKGLSADVIANTPHVLIETERGTRAVTAQLQPAHGVGTVRSADYSPATLKTHLMDSLLDLECAARYRNKRGMGIFILRSDRETVKSAGAIDAVIDSVAFRAPRSLHLEVSQDSHTLAESVAEWAESMSS